MKKLAKTELKGFLDEKAALYEQPKFIETDPVQIPHLFSQKEDIEISGFLTATISWGNRKSILTNAHKLMNLLGNAPFDFVMEHTETDLEKLNGFVHRTFNSIDLSYFITALKEIYTKHGSLEAFFAQFNKEENLQNAIHHFKKEFFSLPHPIRTEKHISDPHKNSAAKRINMYLRWMVRDAKAGVDLGIWKTLSPAQLSCPLDVHSGNIARKLGILNRKQNDGKALLELDNKLRVLDSQDPVKYDYALFGLGVFEKF
ncbi:TIGR02757 family protein [Aquimarina sp. 2201CG5-10]|uniref:TIGR02757 family protein n=1 Tax=Aquimarina callyspongiae TaxID=3098150 RepID=UPI002AB4B836|nr:TIGR02757 family protein [Aquimarina sp. 2201CG5-10]MDY8135596.1 TIGR02757 family protein [Aquimarina sp. 2201CG5-10]